jgi:hypothetical protein
MLRARLRQRGFFFFFQLSQRLRAGLNNFARLDAGLHYLGLLKLAISFLWFFRSFFFQ